MEFSASLVYSVGSKVGEVKRAFEKGGVSKGKSSNQSTDRLFPSGIPGLALFCSRRLAERRSSVGFGCRCDSSWVNPMAQKDVGNTVELVTKSGKRTFSKSLWLVHGGYKDDRCKMANLEGGSDIIGYVTIEYRGEKLDLRSRIIDNSATFRGRWSWGSESSIRRGGSSRMKSELVSMNTKVAIIKTPMTRDVEDKHVEGEYSESKHGKNKYSKDRRLNRSLHRRGCFYIVVSPGVKSDCWSKFGSLLGRKFVFGAA